MTPTRYWTPFTEGPLSNSSSICPEVNLFFPQISWISAFSFSSNSTTHTNWKFLKLYLPTDVLIQVLFFFYFNHSSYFLSYLPSIIKLLKCAQVQNSPITISCKATFKSLSKVCEEVLILSWVHSLNLSQHFICHLWKNGHPNSLYFFKWTVSYHPLMQVGKYHATSSWYF